MHRAVLSDSGDLPIPEEFRVALKLQPRQHVSVELRAGELIIRPEEDPRTVMDLHGCLGSPDTSRASEREVADAITEHLRRENPPPGDPKWINA